MRDPDASIIVQQNGDKDPEPPRRRSRRAGSGGASECGVIQHPAFAIEPWAVRETALDLERLAQTESVFALANGHLGLRGNLDEGEPFGLPGHLSRRASTRPARFRTPSPGTAIRRTGRRSSM